MDVKILLNHFGGPLHLHADVFARVIGEGDKFKWVELLEALFSQPDEVWQLELPGPLHAWRYVKFYQEGAFFGIVDIGRPDDLRIVDWYLLPYDANSPEAEVQAAAIDAQREGQLNHTKLR